MIRWGVVTAIGLGTLLGLMLAQALAEEKSCVSVRVTNCYARTIRIAHGPVDLCAEVRVQQRAEHRWISVEWTYAPPTFTPEALFDAAELDDPFREVEPQNGSLGSSLRSLNGDKHPLRNDVKMSHLSGGTYLVTARVFTDSEHKRACGFASTTVKIQ